MAKKQLKPEQKKKLIWASAFAALLVIAYGIFVLSGLPLYITLLVLCFPFASLSDS
jgi:hypothetical protein